MHICILLICISCGLLRRFSMQSIACIELTIACWAVLSCCLAHFNSWSTSSHGVEAGPGPAIKNHSFAFSQGSPPTVHLGVSVKPKSPFWVKVRAESSLLSFASSVTSVVRLVHILLRMSPQPRWNKLPQYGQTNTHCHSIICAHLTHMGSSISREPNELAADRGVCGAFDSRRGRGGIALRLDLAS